MAAQQVHPEVFWAQRSSSSDATRNVVYLTIMAPDVHKSDLKLDLQSTKLVFTGKSTTKNLTYHAEIEFFAEIDTDESKVNHTDRDIELVLRKKELKEEFWPRLLKDKAKVHWLKTDFDKWVDEDEQEGDGEDEDYMSKMGGMGGMGGPEGGAGGGGFEGIDFSKFGAGGGGGAGGMPDMASMMQGMGGGGGMPDMASMMQSMGGGGMGGMDDDEEDDEDEEEMPDLEGEESHPAPAAGATKKSVIEEVE